MNFSRLLEISLHKTLRLNLHYFGIKAVFHPYILCSKNVRFEKLEGDVKLDSKRFGSVRLGFRSVPLFDYKYQRFCWQNDGLIYFGKNVNLGQGTVISNSGELIIGNNFNISANSKIVCRKSIVIGDDSLISWNCLIMDSDWHRVYEVSDGETFNLDRPIVVGKHVWIGCNSLVLKGAEIPDNSIVAAGSIVSSRLGKTNSIYIGNNQMKDGVNWKY